MGEVSLEEGDYIIRSDTWRGVTISTVGGGSESAESVDDARRAIMALMRRDKFYPTVWIGYDRCDPMVDDEFTYPSEVLHG